MRFNLKAPVVKEGNWQMREGRLSYEAAVYAHEQGILALGFDRGQSLSFIMANEDFFADNPQRQKQLSSSGSISFAFIVASVIGSLAWHWWFFLPCLFAGFVVIAAKMKIGARNCSRIIIEEGLKNKELYNMIQDQDGWYFTAIHPLEEIEKMYQERDPAQDGPPPDSATGFFTTKI